MKLKFKFLFLNTFVANILFAQIFRNNPNYTPIFEDSFDGRALGLMLVINLIAADRFDFNNGFEIGENSEVELTLMNCQ